MFKAKTQPEKQKPPGKSLADHIAEVHAACNELIDAKVAELKKEMPSLPPEVLRREIRGTCLCQQALYVIEKQ